MRKQRLYTGLNNVLLIFATACVLAPIAWMVSISMRRLPEVHTRPPRWIPQEPTAEAFRQVLTSPALLQFLSNSYLVAMATSVVCLLVAMPAAYAFSRYGFIGRNLGELFIVSTQMIPPVVLVIPYFGLLVTVGLFDSLTGLTLTYVSFALPFSILMLTRYFNSVPRDLDESAQVDGASPLRTLRSIIVPVSIPGIIATGVYGFILAWNEFLFAITIVASRESQTFPIAIGMQVGEHITNWPQMMAFSIVGSVPVALGFFVLQRYLVEGLTAGAVK